MEFATANEAIDAFTPGDQRIDLIGYVGTVIENPPPPIDHVRLMFTLNNNRGRTLLVCVWNQVLKDCSDLIKPNAILHISNARCKVFDVPFVRDNSNARINGEAFEIHINHPTTIISKIGEFTNVEATAPDATCPSHRGYDPQGVEEVATAPLILWDKIRELDGQIVRLRGFVKGEFAKLKRCTYGSMTDGRKKFNIVLTNTENLGDFKVGEFIEVEGKINLRGYRTKWYGQDPPGIECDEAKKIKKVDAKLSLVDVLLMGITQYP